MAATSSPGGWPAHHVPLTSSALDAAVLPSDEQVRQLIRGRIYLLVGPPGVGKGTQAQLLAAKYGVVHISTGDLFRAEVKTGSERGARIGEYMARGQFVPAELANPLVTERLSQPDCTANAVLLDGFPRSRSQLDDLDAILAPIGRRLQAALHLDLIDADESVRRIAGRRTCLNSACKAIYNVHAMPPRVPDVCDRCGDALGQRHDDREEVVRARFARDVDAAPALLAELGERDVLFALRGPPPHSVDAVHAKLTELMCYGDERFARRSGSAASRFALQLQHTGSDGDVEALVTAYRDAALAENVHKRTGAMRRWIYLMTTNEHKLQEFVRVFDRYGVEVLRCPPSDDAALIERLLRARTPELIPAGVLAESSLLLRPGSDTELSSLRAGTRADHRSTLRSWTTTAKGDVVHKTYVHTTAGRLRAASDSQQAWLRPVFGWDDRFELLATGRTYQEHVEADLKVSSRDMVVSRFLADRIYYRSLKTLNHMRLDLRRPVDFDADVAAFVDGEAHYNSALAVAWGLRGMLDHVLNEGIFYKAASTRIEANYWQPGLNAGIPLVAKRDPVHERTFMFHDFGHFMMKDLIFTGNDSPLHRAVYIAQRLISEAVTIMSADGIFVDTMRRSGVDYDFAARQIYPLFQACGLDFAVDDRDAWLRHYRTIAKASVDYTVKGDDGAFRRLLAANGQPLDVLHRYQAKFKPFFVSDYQWTVHNYDHMVGRAAEMRTWWQLSAPVRAQLDLPLETIDEFIDLLPPDARHALPDVDALVDMVFDVVFERRIRPVFAAGPVALLPWPLRQRRGFLRWLVGQIGLYARFASVPGTRQQLDQLVGRLQQGASIAEVRACYESFVRSLTARNLISVDDECNYVEIYPLFEPFYVTYDKNEAYPDIAPLARRSLDWHAQRDTARRAAESHLHRPVTDAERRLHAAVVTMVQHGRGQLEDGAFVTRPGLALIAATDDHLTVLLSGVAESTAHTVAALCRAAAVHVAAADAVPPLFRLHDEAGRPARNYVDLALSLRSAFEARARPQHAWGPDGAQLWHAMLPACRATAVLLTASLADWRALAAQQQQQHADVDVRQLAERLHALLADTAAAGQRQHTDEDRLLASSRLTATARVLFRQLHVVGDSDEDLLGDFAARLPSCSFAEQPPAAPIDPAAHRRARDAAVTVCLPLPACDADTAAFIVRHNGTIASHQGRSVVSLSIAAWRQLLDAQTPLAQSIHSLLSFYLQ